MRDRVVHMQQVELIELGHLCHARCQREIVRRVLEERILIHLDLVKANICLTAAQPEGRGRGDEVYFVSARGQFNTQLRRDDSAATVGRVAGDADLAPGSHEYAGYALAISATPAMATIDWLYGAFRTPRSVMIAVTYFAGVTSNAGFSMPTPWGVICLPFECVTSRALRCSMGMSSPCAVARSNVDHGAAT